MMKRLAIWCLVLMFDCMQYLKPCRTTGLKLLTQAKLPESFTNPAISHWFGFGVKA